MAFARMLRCVGGAALTGALLAAAAPAATADDGARAAEWPLTAYAAQQKVWPLSTGQGVVVAVLDSGIRATHLDLTGQVLPGIDFAHGGNGQHDYASDGHGTGIASLIAGHGHGHGDAAGIKGLAPEAKILPVGIGDSNNADYLPQAIRFAVDHGAKVINMSVGSSTPSAAEEDAVAYAEAHNVVLVAAAGNAGTEENEYPASYPGVISVSGIDQNDGFWSGSSYGPHVVVAAPAEGIVRDGDGSDTQYYKGDGTSFSTAYVSAIAALVRAKYPSLTAGQVVNRIIKSASLPAGLSAPDPKWGYGAARPDKALSMNIPAGPADGPLPQATAPGTAPGGSAATTKAAASKSSSSSTLLVAAVAGAVVLLAVIVLVVVLLRRRNRGSGGGPGGPAGGAGPYTYPQYGGQPYGGPPPGGQPHQSVYQRNPYDQQPPPPYNPGGGGPS